MLRVVLNLRQRGVIDETFSVVVANHFGLLSFVKTQNILIRVRLPFREIFYDRGVNRQIFVFLIFENIYLVTN